MARFTTDSRDRVKDAADIVEIVSAYTDLQQRGQDYWGNCPFHEERTPSFKVNPRDKLYYCFGCEASGDVFRFVEEKEGLSCPEAVEALAERYGVGLERGLGEEVLRRFGVGMAPSPWDQVLTGSQRAGFKVEELVAAGLAQKGRQGGHYDRFRNRITFPIRDQRGRVLGFGARALSPGAQPKYLNSPEGELYRKSHTLYGIDQARGPIAKARRAILVEGYTDVLALHQAGVEEAVAIMGTALTPEQLSLLAGLTDSVVLALDADAAGADAMIRAQKVAGGRGLELRVTAMPEGEDPADLLQGGSVDRFMELVEGAIDLPSFRVDVALGRGDLGSLAGRERVLQEVGPVLKAMGETALGFDELVRKVADRLDTDPSLVLARVRSAPEGGVDGNGAKPAPRPVAVSLTPRETRERALLAMCIAAPAAGRRLIDALTK